MKLFHWYLSAWLLETTLWLVGVLWAAQTGAADMKGSALEQREIWVKEASVQSLTNSAVPRFEAEIPRPNDSKYPLEGSTARRQMQAVYGRLPLSFEVNRGQAQNTVKFLSRSSNHSLFLT